jgi:long-chain acyl-CoA synthetase
LVDSGAEILICQDFLYGAVEKTGLELRHVILTSITDSLSTVNKLMGKNMLRGAYQKMEVPPPAIYEKKNFHKFQDLLKKSHDNVPTIEIDPREDLMSLPYTGGTTGKPKGVLLTHYNAVAQVTQLKTFLSMLKEGKEVWISYMPFYHAAGQVMCLLQGVLQGFTQVVITTPEVDDILYSILKYRAESFFGPPAIYEMLKDYDKTDRINWRDLKILLCGADALHEATAEGWKARTNTCICEGYGQTECVCVTHLNPPGTEKIGSVGIPLCNTVAAVVDPEKDEFVPLNEIGEIVVSGPQVTKGYWQNPKATQECIAEIDGTKWWRTGDLGRMDENGFFYIYDRKRDLIKYKGLRIFAREVEEVLRTHPKIKEAGVIGIPDIKVGQQVKAIVILESDSRGSISEADIIEYCKDKLAPYKIPKIIEFAGELPRTDVGKVSRRELREEES